MLIVSQIFLFSWICVVFLKHFLFNSLNKHIIKLWPQNDIYPIPAVQTSHDNRHNNSSKSNNLNRLTILFHSFLSARLARVGGHDSCVWLCVNKRSWERFLKCFLHYYTLVTFSIILFYLTTINIDINKLKRHTHSKNKTKRLNLTVFCLHMDVVWQ